MISDRMIEWKKAWVVLKPVEYSTCTVIASELTLQSNTYGNTFAEAFDVDLGTKYPIQEFSERKCTLMTSLLYIL